MRRSNAWLWLIVVVAALFVLTAATCHAQDDSVTVIETLEGDVRRAENERDAAQDALAVLGNLYNLRGVQMGILTDSVSVLNVEIADLRGDLADAERERDAAADARDEALDLAVQRLEENVNLRTEIARMTALVIEMDHLARLGEMLEAIHRALHAEEENPIKVAPY